MHPYELGLDIGPNSIGWCLVDEANQKIHAAGVRVFPEGVDRDQQGGEKSKSASRRTARGMRRQIARRARRKRALRDLLSSAGLLPQSPVELDELLGTNPYQLRARALDHKLTLFEIGRVVLHLNQRRGFLSNRKTDKARDSDTKGMLAEISSLAALIQERGCRTLGEYLATLDQGFSHTRAEPEHRVRHRHTRRDMYCEEFKAIWNAQQRHYPELLNQELKDRVSQIIFFQRKMYWPKSVVGACELEPKLKRCARADRLAQKFRILQEINNLRLYDRSTAVERRLSPDERSTLLAYLCHAKVRTFEQIRKKLGFSEGVRFNLEGPERDKLKGHETDTILSSTKSIGKRWTEFSDQDKNQIVDVLIEEDDEVEAMRRLTAQCGLTMDEAQKALAVNLPDGYASFSRTAIERLLPHLERGLLLMADDPSNSALHAAGYLRPDERQINVRDSLPPSPNVTNPIVRQALVEVRKLVNAIIREYRKPRGIRVELAREAKKSFQERRQLRFDLADRRKLREAAAEEIEKHGAKATRSTVDRFLLWKEQNGLCIYSGRCISLAQLLNGEANADHILPRWRSLDDSLANQVVCFRDENDTKGDRTPCEWLEATNPEKYAQVLRRAEVLPYNKQRKFIQKDIVLDDFVSRQLTDTAYISRLVTQYLNCLGAPIVMPRGQMTAELRHVWGLNTILDPDGGGKKNRADHRHHAVDALVLALTDRKRLHALANDRGRDVKPPWEGFRDQATETIKGIHVSHRALRGIRGALHEDTFYGKTDKQDGAGAPAGGVNRPWSKGWIEEENTYVRRKFVAELTNTKQLAKIRDEAIRHALIDHIRRHGVEVGSATVIPKSVWAVTPRMPSGVPIHKVRMIEQGDTFRRVSNRRSYQFVKPGSNHHIVYSAIGEGADERWTAKVVPMWDATLRARQGFRVVEASDQQEGRFVFSLSIGEAFQIDSETGEALLCIVQKMRQDDGRINYRLHTDARPSAEAIKENLTLSPEKMKKRNSRKVVVDLLGRIRRAKD